MIDAGTDDTVSVIEGIARQCPDIRTKILCNPRQMGASQFNQLGDLERRALRSGNVHSAADWRNVLEPVVAR